MRLGRSACTLRTVGAHRRVSTDGHGRPRTGRSRGPSPDREGCAMPDAIRPARSSWAVPPHGPIWPRCPVGRGPRAVRPIGARRATLAPTSPAHVPAGRHANIPGTCLCIGVLFNEPWVEAIGACRKVAGQRLDVPDMYPCPHTTGRCAYRPFPAESLKSQLQGFAEGVGPGPMQLSVRRSSSSGRGLP